MPRSARGHVARECKLSCVRSLGPGTATTRPRAVPYTRILRDAQAILVVVGVDSQSCADPTPQRGPIGGYRESEGSVFEQVTSRRAKARLDDADYRPVVGNDLPK